MRLGLSSDVAIGATIPDLIAACERRGLAVLEPNLARVRADDIPRGTHRTNVRISGVLAGAATDARCLADLSAAADAPIIVDDADRPTALDRARAIRECGGAALALVRGPAGDWLDDVVDAALRFAWQVDDSCSDPAADARAILQRTGSIDYIRLVGGGPETMQQEGRGVGALMRQLALAAYTGPLILTPGSDRYRVAWSTWLGRRGGWGCGSTAGRTTELNILE